MVTSEDDKAEQRGEALSLNKLPADLVGTSATQLDLSSSGLRELPDSLQQLTALVDLSVARNELSALPSWIGQLQGLRFLNAMCNQVQRVPDELCHLSALYRLGLKSNVLTDLPAGIGKLSGLVELFLTDNQLTHLPDSLGMCTNLVKLQASRNCLTTLPASLGHLPKLELLRVAVNRLESLPKSVLSAPSLAWVSLSGNPLCPEAQPPTHTIQDISINDVSVGAKLGDGASGEVFQVSWQGRECAMKVFKADDASPDGQACDEIAVQLFLEHPSLTLVVARIREPDALVMKLVEGKPMAEKPNLQSLLRCRWTLRQSFSPGWVLRAALGVAGALNYMHEHCVAHGDVYAHNMLAADNGATVLCDYGAAFFYSKAQRALQEAIEVRAYGLFLRDVVDRMQMDEAGSEEIQNTLQMLVDDTLSTKALTRPAFRNIVERLNQVQTS